MCAAGAVFLYEQTKYCSINKANRLEHTKLPGGLKLFKKSELDSLSLTIKTNPSPTSPEPPEQVWVPLAFQKTLPRSFSGDFCLHFLASGKRFQKKKRCFPRRWPGLRIGIFSASKLLETHFQSRPQKWLQNQKNTRKATKNPYKTL